MKTLTQGAEMVITVVADHSDEIDALSFKEALEDGEALTYFGFTDEDQDAIEEAHAYLTELVDNNMPLVLPKNYLDAIEEFHAYITKLVDNNMPLILTANYL